MLLLTAKLKWTAFGGYESVLGFGLEWYKRNEGTRDIDLRRRLRRMSHEAHLPHTPWDVNSTDHLQIRGA